MFFSRKKGRQVVNHFSNSLDYCLVGKKLNTEQTEPAAGGGESFDCSLAYATGSVNLLSEHWTLFVLR